MGIERILELQQVCHIAGRVTALVVGERTSQPVGEAVALRCGDPQLGLEQRDQRRRAVAEETGGELGVVHAPWHRTDGVMQYVEILLCRMQHRQYLAVEQQLQGAEVHRQRVHEHDLAGAFDLQQRQLRKVRALAMELGIERIPRRLEQTADELSEFGRVVDPAMSHEGELPVTTGRPLAIQSSVPPATFTTSTPCCTRYSHAFMLRAPLRQMT